MDNLARSVCVSWHRLALCTSLISRRRYRRSCVSTQARSVLQGLESSFSSSCGSEPQYTTELAASAAAAAAIFRCRTGSSTQSCDGRADCAIATLIHVLLAADGPRIVTTENYIWDVLERRRVRGAIVPAAVISRVHLVRVRVVKIKTRVRLEYIAQLDYPITSPRSQIHGASPWLTVFRNTISTIKNL